MTSDATEPDVSLSTHEVCAATGATFRMIDYWTKKGYLTCIERTRQSSGAKRRYTRAEAAVAQMMLILITAGIEPGTAARAGRAMVLHGIRRIALDEQVSIAVSFPAGVQQIAP